MRDRSYKFVKNAAGAGIALIWLSAMASCDIFSSSGGGPTYLVGINFHLVDMDGSDAATNSRIDAMMSVIRRVYKPADFQVDSVKVFKHTGPDAARLTYIDWEMDADGSGWPDQMEELLTWSAQARDQNLDIFIVRSINHPEFDILGVAGGVPGPAVKGTPHSGMILSAFGDFYSMSQGELELQATTVVHEAGHYLGSWHTTESDGLEFDFLTDTPECYQWIYDRNGDGQVSSSECYDQDGQYLMFWAAADFQQEKISAQQKAEWSAHGYVRKK